MKQIVLVSVVFNLLLMNAFPAQDLKSTIVDMIQEEVEPYQSELKLAQVSSFANRLANTLITYQEKGYEFDKNLEYLPEFVRRYIFFDGGCIDDIVGAYFATSFVRNIEQRKCSNCPVLTKEQAAPAIENLNFLEDESIGIIQHIDFNQLKYDRPDNFESTYFEQYRQKTIDQIRQIFWVHRDALTNPTYPYSVRNLSKSDAQAKVDEFQKIVTDLMNLEKSVTALKDQYPGLIHIASESMNKTPDILRLRKRLLATVTTLSFLSGPRDKPIEYSDGADAQKLKSINMDYESAKLKKESHISQRYLKEEKERVTYPKLEKLIHESFRK